jgi:hypothetical protein
MGKAKQAIISQAVKVDFDMMARDRARSRRAILT